MNDEKITGEILKMSLFLFKTFCSAVTRKDEVQKVKCISALNMIGFDIVKTEKGYLMMKKEKTDE